MGCGIREQGKSSKEISQRISSVMFREPIKFSEWKALNDYLHIYKMQQWKHFWNQGLHQSHPWSTGEWVCSGEEQILKPMN